VHLDAKLKGHRRKGSKVLRPDKAMSDTRRQTLRVGGELGQINKDETGAVSGHKAKRHMLIACLVAPRED
jgi:hypothetical protein